MTDGISQKIKGGARSICPACIHYDVCKATNNQPCVECTQFINAADVRETVLCRDCAQYVESEEVNGEKMCVRDADWSVEDGCYYGFTEYPPPDWFCADGKKR